jgi:L-alanine-DL-glutamate epimerase-like enolase superfamily enzyme
LRAAAAAVPDARFRLDANAGFSASQALALLEAVLGDGLGLECFEQPCAADDLAGMAEVTARSPVPVVADESFRGPADLDRLVAARAAAGVNLKLGKLGGPLAALALAERARAAGLRLMAGAMVETRVGLLAMAHVVAALGGVDWVDLDTAFLLADDPFEGGWSVEGPRIRLASDPGLGVRRRP